MPNAPEIQIGCVSNIYTRSMHFLKAGDKEIGHSHVFDHLSLLTKGSLQVTVDGQVSVFKAPHMIFITKNKNHELVALEDDTLTYCIHALRDGDGVGDIIGDDMVPKGIKPFTNDNRQ